MRTNNDLVFIANAFLGKFDTDGMSFLRSDLTRRKGLDDVITQSSAGFAIAQLGAAHIIESCFYWCAVEGGFK